MWTQHNRRVPRRVIAMISKGCFWQVSNIIINFLFRDFLYLIPSVVFWISIGHALVKVTRKNKGMYEKDLVFDHLQHTKWLLVTNQEPAKVSLCTFKPVSRTTCETSWGKLQNFTWNKVDNFTVCFSSKQWHICLFFVSHLWTMKLIESKNVFCISGRVVCTVKLNIKETFMGNDSFHKRLKSDNKIPTAW